MKYLSIVIGFIAIILMFFSIIPCLGAVISWINIPLSIIGFLFAYWPFHQSEENKKDTMIKIGMIVNACALIVGIIRLISGGGVV